MIKRVFFGLVIVALAGIAHAQPRQVDRELGLAVMEGDPAKVSTASSAGADPNAKLSSDEEFEFATPSMVAIAFDQPEIIDQLVRAGANPASTPYSHFVACSQIRANIVSWFIDQADFDENECIQLAIPHVSYGVSRFFQLMLEAQIKGVPVEEIYPEEWVTTPLNKLLDVMERRKPAQNDEHPIARTVKILLDAGADPNGWLASDTIDLGLSGDSEKISLLIAALRLGELWVSELLINRGADSPIRQIYLQEALVGVARYGERNVIESLINQGADPNKANSIGEYSLPAAAEKNKEENAVVLLMAGAQPMLVGSRQTPLLTSMVKWGHFRLGEALKNYDINVDGEDEKGRWPLRLAVERGDTKMVDVLLKLGADPNYRTARRQSALHGLDYLNRGYSRGRLTLLPEHYPIAEMLFKAGFSDNDQKSPLLSSYDKGSQDALPFLDHIISLGARFRFQWLSMP